MNTNKHTNLSEDEGECSLSGGEDEDAPLTASSSPMASSSRQRTTDPPDPLVLLSCMSLSAGRSNDSGSTPRDTLLEGKEEEMLIVYITSSFLHLPILISGYKKDEEARNRLHCMVSYR